MAKGDLAEDPAGLIYEAYRIDGITTEECRTIFLDFVLGIPADADNAQVLTKVHAHYAAANPGHPMTMILEESMQAAGGARRRGGRLGRRAG